MIRCENHPFAVNNFVKEHRLIAEKYLLNDNNSIIIDGKKYLSPNFNIHHIDFNKLNNKKENLLILSRSEHIRLHNKLKCEENLLNYCKHFNLDYEIVKQTEIDFRTYNCKKYI